MSTYRTLSTTTHRALVATGSLALLMLSACGSEDPSDPDPSSPSALTLSCGSAQLFSVVHDVCAPMDAQGTHDESTGPCDCALGYAWNGTSCDSLGDCACTGEDCSKLTQTKEECEQAHASCGSTPIKTLSCGSTDLFSLSHDICEAMDAAATHDPATGPCDCFLGYAWNGSSCEMLGDCACTGEDCDKLTQSKEECEQAHAACIEPPSKILSCGSGQLFSWLHDACAPMDAADWHDPATGPCDCFLGYAWNGTACFALGDCACAGEDCDKLTPTEEECEAAHAGC